ncbi:hypothetical protein Taro_047348 [Colocasia esculenta]|uniref:LOB domain-containing protein n=1 Tax=Colocasia esculenta TaxID=4460 RepID=A0A843WVY8_COLES|nr:hypothetical protein [Colocasia esculenta]
MSCGNRGVSASTGCVVNGNGVAGSSSIERGGPGGASGGGGGPCGACKFLRRKCVSGCLFAPHFNAEAGAAHFAAVHRVFGASNVSKLLQRVTPHRRPQAVLTMCYEAHARLRDPVLGCVSHIFALQQQVLNLEAELGLIQSHLAALHAPRPAAAPEAPQQPSQLVGGSRDGRANGCCPFGSSCSLSTVFDPLLLHLVNDAGSRCCKPAQLVEHDEVEEQATDYFAKYFQGVK